MKHPIELLLRRWIIGSRELIDRGCELGLLFGNVLQTTTRSMHLNPWRLEVPAAPAPLRFALTSARVLLVSDEPQSARVQLQSILKEATARGFVGSQFEARLALGELEKKLRQTPAAQAQLAALEKTARTRGFGLIARKAETARD